MTAIHIVPTLSDNYSYVIEAPQGAIIVDCGEAAPVVDFLKRKNLTATHLLLTHHHADHIDGAAALKTSSPMLVIYGPQKDRFRISSMQEGVTDGAVLSLHGIDFHAIETPGHTAHHLCFYAPALHALFSGDTLFSLGCGRLLEGTATEMFLSLEKLKVLPDDTRIFCGHEYTEKNAAFALSLQPADTALQTRLNDIRTQREKGLSTLPVDLAGEKALNPFLLAKTAEDFARLRELRNRF